MIIRSLLLKLAMVFFFVIGYFLLDGLLADCCDNEAAPRMIQRADGSVLFVLASSHDLVLHYIGLPVLVGLTFVLHYFAEKRVGQSIERDGQHDRDEHVFWPLLRGLFLVGLILFGIVCIMQPCRRYSSVIVTPNEIKLQTLLYSSGVPHTRIRDASLEESSTHRNGRTTVHMRFCVHTIESQTLRSITLPVLEKGTLEYANAKRVLDALVRVVEDPKPAAQ